MNLFFHFEMQFFSAEKLWTRSFSVESTVSIDSKILNSSFSIVFNTLDAELWGTRNQNKETKLNKAEQMHCKLQNVFADSAEDAGSYGCTSYFKFFAAFWRSGQKLLCSINRLNYIHQAFETLLLDFLELFSAKMSSRSPY